MELKKEDAQTVIEFLKRYGSGKITIDGVEGSVGSVVLAIVLSSAIRGDEFAAYQSNGDLKIELIRDNKKQTIVLTGILANKEEA